MLKGKKILLRTVKEADLHLFFQMQEKMRFEAELFLEDLESEYRFKEKFYETGFWGNDAGTLLIVNQKDVLLGCISYKKNAFFDAYELKYFIFNKEDRNKGVMSETLQLFSGYLFASKRINRLQLFIPNYHRASIAVAQKCGFIFEGIARESVFLQGKHVDICMYSKLRSECKNIAKLF